MEPGAQSRSFMWVGRITKLPILKIYILCLQSLFQFSITLFLYYSEKLNFLYGSTENLEVILGDNSSLSAQCLIILLLFFCQLSFLNISICLLFTTSTPHDWILCGKSLRYASHSKMISSQAYFMWCSKMKLFFSNPFQSQPWDLDILGSASEHLGAAQSFLFCSAWLFAAPSLTPSSENLLISVESGNFPAQLGFTSNYVYPSKHQGIYIPPELCFLFIFSFTNIYVFIWKK